MPTDGLPVPSTPDSITPEWLTAALRNSGTLKDAQVVSVTAKPIAAGSGFVGQSARLHIEYDKIEPEAPAVLFAKLSSADPAVRERLRTVGLYETEAGFYRDLAGIKTMLLCAPRPYLSLYDEETSACILLMEDVGHARFGDNIAGLSPADARIAVRQIALIHAHFWEADSLKRLPWLHSLSDTVVQSTAMARALVPVFEERWAQFLTPNLRQVARSYAEVLPTYYEHISTRPQTLVHGDFRADNFAFRSSPQGNAPQEDGFVVFDWQNSRRSIGARDLAYLLAGSLDIESRREMESSLLHLYHETLMANGVRNYSPQDLELDLRAGLQNSLIVLIVSGAMLDFANERGMQLAQALCDRLGAMMEDHQFAEYLTSISQ